MFFSYYLFLETPSPASTTNNQTTETNSVENDSTKSFNPITTSNNNNNKSCQSKGVDNQSLNPKDAVKYNEIDRDIVP